MNINAINSSGVRIFSGDVLKDINNKNADISIIINDEYIKSMNYQKQIRNQGMFYIGGELLYTLLSELFDYIAEMFDKIRLDDVNIHDEENRTLLFLRKFSRSSEIIEKKIQLRTSETTRYSNSETFQIHISGKENSISFARKEENQSRLTIAIPQQYLYNRLISHMDKMEFTDLMQLDKNIRHAFLKNFIELNQKIGDKRNQIDIRYALELAQGRIQDLEKENSRLHNKVSLMDYQNKLYKRSYFSLKNRYSKMLERFHSKEEDEQDIEEITPLPT